MTSIQTDPPRYGEDWNPLSELQERLSGCPEWEVMRFSVPAVRRMVAHMEAGSRRMEALEEALRPSGETKAAYIGEFSLTFPVAYTDEDGEPQEEQRRVNVPWTTIKEIMAAIRSRADLTSKGT